MRRKIVIQPCISVDQPGWLELREALWLQDSQEEHRTAMASLIASPRRYAQFIAYAESRLPVGIVEASLRSDYVNGTNSSPVGFVEGIYVASEHRR